MSTPQDNQPVSTASSPTNSSVAGASSSNNTNQASQLPNAFAPPTLNQPFSLKLDRNNYTLWKTMVSTIVRGHRLHGYLSGTLMCPPEFVMVGDTQVTNPEYENWIITDQLLMGWLYSSMTEGIATEVMGSHSAANLQRNLESLYGAYSKSKMDDTRTLIQTTRKGSTLMSEYLRQKKNWSNMLALAGDPYPEAHLVANVLFGLDAEYLSIVVQIEARSNTTWQELQDLLLSFDSKIERLQNLTLNSNKATSSSPQANMAAKTNNNGRGRGFQSQNASTNSGGLFSNSRGTSNRFRGRGRGPGSGSRPTCQVYGKYGHTAAVCYNRFDESYMGSDPNNPHNQNKAGQTNNNHSAFVATPEVLEFDAWFADSGASNHITSDPANLTQKQDYNGKESVVVGNGSKLRITHIGNGKLNIESGNYLLLKDMLLVPKIAKNLVSVSKLATDNNVLIEFYSNFCLVKDKVTKKVLLHGVLKDELYQLDSPFTKSSHPYQQSNFLSAFTISVDSNVNQSQTDSLLISQMDVGHRRLGHPSIKVLNHVLESVNVSVSKNAMKTVCDACQYGKAHALPFRSSNTRAKSVLDLIHTDLWGPAPIASNINHHYYIHFVDDYSRYTWLYPLKLKSDALAAFIQFKALVENQFYKKIKSLRSDSGGEYKPFVDLVQTHGIEFQHPCPHTSPQNGRAQRKHRHTVEMGLTLLAQATCFPCLRHYQSHKFQFHSIKCVNLGYSDSYKGYKCLSPTGRIYISQDVVFNEMAFPFKTGFLNNYNTPQPIIIHSTSWSILLIHCPSPSPSSVTSSSTDTSPKASPATSSSSPRAQSPIVHYDSPSSVSSHDRDSDQYAHDLQHEHNLQQISNRVEPTGAEIVQDIPTEHNAPLPSHPMITRGKVGIFKPRTFVSQMQSESTITEPVSVVEAIKHPGWFKAMNLEFYALKSKGTRILVPPSDAYNLVGNKWVYRIKFNADGTVNRLKARLVAKGFHQRPGINYGETFSPIIKAATVRIILTIVVSRGWEISSKAYTSLFFYKDEKVIILALIYVDDIIITENDKSKLRSFITELNKKFTLKDIGPLQYFLGIEAYRDASGLYLTQTRYIEDILKKKVNMTKIKTCPKLMTVGKPLSLTDGKQMENPTLYRSTVGALQYLCHTRPDIAYGTKTKGLHISCSDRLSITGFSDADWACCPDDSRSVAGYCVYLGDTLVSWSSKKQVVVSRSSTESEYRALAHVAAEISWIESLLKELNFPFLSPSVTWYDNLSASALAANPVFHARTKHIEIDAHYVRDKVLQKQLEIRYIPSHDQIADCLTKGLSPSRFAFLVDKLGVRNSPFRLRGDVKE
uniref:Integrase catalytic domain-containing protein n=1 Tax=Cannabis sativa TaxID=3483 RepID=A0A803PEH4_CANSA